MDTSKKVAYFCAEYALSDQLPIYAGGLGVLAGDYLREAADKDVPIVAVGLYYSQGFVRRELSLEGKVVDLHEQKKPLEAGLSVVLGEDEQRLLVKVPIQDRQVEVGAYLWERGSVRLYLLSTEIESNSMDDQHITDTLYTSEKETRLKQEMVLGIGGLKMLEAVGYHPDFYHLNEGHSAFMCFELIRKEMRDHNLDFEKAKELTKSKVLFTNHTLVAAGSDLFSNDLVALQLSKFAEELPTPVTELVKLGLVQDSSSFSMTMLAMRTAGKMNGVSKLHTQKAKEMWHNHPIFPITNGIHIPTWDRIRDDEIWERHCKNKRELLNYIAEKSGVVWEERPLMIGWGRRIVSYKRPLALIERLKRFGELAQSKERPLRVVFAGLSHPADTDGAEILEELRYRLETDLKGVAVYLPHYNMELSALMVSGCDLWLNTPVVGFEACGTSGMKAALNGSLPLTTKDGWAAEVDLYGAGWSVPDNELTDAILDRLEEDILPLYFERQEDGRPEKWIEMMVRARELVLGRFSMSRVLAEYLQTYNH